MISKAAILERAAEWQLTPEVVEKDYVLGWMLAGIALHPATTRNWVFKGGTCLKKCVIETYRFSEDLDTEGHRESKVKVREVVRDASSNCPIGGLPQALRRIIRSRPGHNIAIAQARAAHCRAALQGLAVRGQQGPQR